MKGFSDKIVVITGAASGMGRAYALAFARQGSRLALCDRDAEGLGETTRQIEAQGFDTPLQQVLDISDKNSVDEFAKQVKQSLGNAHIIINNAGIEGYAKPVWASEDQHFRRVMDVNYFGVVHGTRAFLPQLLSNGEGAVVNVSSIFGLIGTPNHADYCASKFAVRGFTEALMAELTTSPIQVHLVHPGGIDTNISRQAHSRAFSDHYLQTPPGDMAEHLLVCLKKNRARVIFGHGSTKTWLAVRLLPLKWLSRILWSEMKKVIDVRDYSVLPQK